ncbi:MAG: tetratricopeptide repeat protein [Candidatus Dormibacterales bacterium]
MQSRREGRRRPRLKGVDVRPGSVKQARAEAGMSLAQVAGADITRAAIHLIENGRSRPSMPTLELIARRTGRPVSFFLPEPSSVPGGSGVALSRLDEIEGLAAREDFRGVIAVAEPQLEELNDAWTEARLRFHVGGAHTRLMETEQGGPHLRRARELFESLGDRWMVVECMDRQAVAMLLEQNPGSLELAQEALRECRRLDPVPVPTEARILSHIGGMHVARHDWARAIESYREALEVAGGLRDLNRLAQMYEGLSVAYRALGSPARAAEYAHKAIAIHSLMRDQASLSRAHGQLGVVLMHQGDLESAERHLRDAIALRQAMGIDRGVGGHLISLGELELARGDRAAAEALIKEGMETADRLGERLSLAAGHQALGQLAAQLEDRERTDREFTAAVALLKELRVDERLVEAYSGYAEILEGRGDTELALAQWKLALALSRPQLVRGQRTLEDLGELIG